MTAQQPASPTPALPATPPPPGSVPTAPPAAAAPIAAVAGASTIPLTGVPQTREELSALQVRRQELSNQLASVTARRNQLARERIRAVDGADRTGLDSRLQFLDRRILQLESDIALNGQQIAAAPATLLATTTVSGGRPRGEVMQRGAVAIGSLMTIFVLAPLALSAARLMWRRATQPAPARDPETSQRLASLEAAVDTIAVEIERVAEGQRFLTRLLAESTDAAHLEALQAPRATAGAASRDA